jgi:soluble lytic murein transglycosylase-like protein
MKSVLIMVQMLCAIAICGAQSGNRTTRLEAEYYVAADAEHYRVPVALVRAIVQQESNWQVCSISPKGAVGLMQLMPVTAQRLGVTDLCNPGQNVSGGVRHLAWLMSRFHNDLRLVAAAYYAGEGRITPRGLSYRNPDVVAYVLRIRTAYLRETEIEPGGSKAPEKRDVK